MLRELIITRECGNCGMNITADQPFISGKWVGVQALPHGCPEEYDIVHAIPRDKAVRQQYIDFFYEVAENLEL